MQTRFYLTITKQGHVQLSHREPNTDIQVDTLKVSVDLDIPDENFPPHGHGVKELENVKIEWPSNPFPSHA